MAGRANQHEKVFDQINLLERILICPKTPGDKSKNNLLSVYSVVNTRSMPSYNIQIRSKGYKHTPK